jgi:KUP system potassium uptake protein
MSASQEGPKNNFYFLLLSLTALGIVYGDIGTSPLYALRESFHSSHGVGVNRENILGILSLVFWSLVSVISIKYASLILKMDNRGEGGILALMNLVVVPNSTPSTQKKSLVLLGLFGAALLYGDGAITPAISVLSAVEGLEVATPFFRPYILPITISILLALFALQKRGTAKVGKIFGPITIVWFLVLAVLGISWIIEEPSVLLAVNPLYALEFFQNNGFSGFLSLCAVFLVVTGGEALYADLGHVGRAPIRFAWFGLVLPALLLNYFGQGAFLIHNPGDIDQSFYHMVPDWALYPVVLLATLSTVIASQALITGTFSLTTQAVQLGYIPRVRIEHTSAKEKGQIYIPAVNWILMLACVGLVIGFGTSSKMAAAYGVAVTLTMVLTTLLFFFALRERWQWSLTASLLVAGLFLLIDVSFAIANLFKIAAGGWFPLLMGAAIFFLMLTWKRGRVLLGQRIQEKSIPLERFFTQVEKQNPPRIPGFAIFMYSNLTGTPLALLTSLKHYKSLHERIILLTVQTTDSPRVALEDRATLTELQSGFYQAILRFGFMETPDVPLALGYLQVDGISLSEQELTYFLGRETVLPTERPGMAMWRERLFSFMSRNARSATDFFRLPPERVVELGAQIEL